MKDPIGTLARCFNRFAIGDVGVDDLKASLFPMVPQIGLTTDGKVVDDPHPPAFGDQPIDEVTADEAGPARNDV